MTTSTKKQHPKLTNFLILNYKTFPIFRGLNSPSAQSAGELWPLAKMAKVTVSGTWIFTQFLLFEP